MRKDEDFVPLVHNEAPLVLNEAKGQDENDATLVESEKKECTIGRADDTGIEKGKDMDDAALRQADDTRKEKGEDENDAPLVQSEEKECTMGRADDTGIEKGKDMDDAALRQADDTILVESEGKDSALAREKESAKVCADET